ncbi:DsbA family protein [Coxiella endosymbiont of Ornithodoros maritimus]|uniref:DsbA family protein n=1 Tax=Coxiella endosymbiont of Ornithodoros maritimus TaxID=1656172 RepID=UPI002263D3A5|nr:DsbA family protein [Coxiella endosymbiont of Ornithodoros maritimus]
MKNCLTSLFLAGTLTAGVAIAGSSQSSFSPQQVKDIQSIIHDYLVNHPEVVVEASQAWQKQTEAQQQEHAAKAIKENAKQLFNDPTSPVAGNPQGNVTLVEFFDYQCGYCKAMNSVIQSIVKRNKNLRVVFKELSIFGGQSQYAAKASLAAAKQRKYYDFHNALLSVDGQLSEQITLKTAEKLGLNLAQLKKEMDNPATQKQLRDNFQLAQSLELAGTPTFVIGNKTLAKFGFIPGATSQQNLQKEIDRVGK